MSGAGWGFFNAMRHFERRAGKKPRVGQSQRVAEDIVDMGQDPYTGFAPDDLSEFDATANPPIVRPRFLGFFGPFGPLPHAMTREVDRWARNGDRAFVRFADIFVARFQQLFYRSWSDARPITQHDHPSGGQFPRFLRAFTGDASPAFDNIAPVDDTVRLRYTALLMGRVRSPVRLAQVLRAHFGVQVRIEEFVPSWLDFLADDMSHLGTQGMTLGQDVRLGRRVPSVCEKVVIHVYCPTLAIYRDFIPGQTSHAALREMVLGYMGGFVEVDVALWLPHAKVPPAQLGTVTELGYTSNLPPSTPRNIPDEMVRAAQFQVTIEETFA